MTNKVTAAALVVAALAPAIPCGAQAAEPAAADMSGAAVSSPAASATSQPLDNDMRRVLDAQAALGSRPVEQLDVTGARTNPTIAAAVDQVLQQQGRSTRPEDLVPGVASRDITVAGATGPLAARLYTPPGSGPFPMVLYFHGGGWVVADKDAYDRTARGLSRQSGAVVISVDYRRAPEAKFPAAWDDALAAYRWTLANGRQLGADPGRIALAGESAGGNLAVATAVAARDAGLQRPTHVLAIYPITQTSLDTVSYRDNADARPLDRAAVGWFVQRAIRSPEDLLDPRLQLVDADLRGLPPVTIVNARVDPLRSDGARLKDALENADVSVERRDYEGVTHEFFGAAAVVDKARQAQAWAGRRLREAFAG